MENSIKQEFSILLARRCAQGLLYLALFLSLVHMATKGWNLIGDNVKLVFLEGTETTILLSTLFHFAIGVIVIIEFLICGTKMISGGLTKNYVLKKGRLYFFVYVISGISWYLCFIGTEYVSSNQLEQLLGNFLIYILFRRITAVKDRKLKLKIFPLSENALSIKADTFKLPAEWEKFLIYQHGQKEITKTYKLGSGGTWFENSHSGNFVACYRNRYTPFHFKVENNQLYPTEIAYGKLKEQQ